MNSNYISHEYANQLCIVAGQSMMYVIIEKYYNLMRQAFQSYNLMWNSGVQSIVRYNGST